MTSQPYEFPSVHRLTASDLRDYTVWLGRRVEIEWKSPGVERTDQARDNGKKSQRPYEFRKSTGIITLQKDLRPFAVYVLAKLQKWANRKPYVPTRTRGWATIADLRDFDSYIQSLLAEKKREQSA